MPTIDVSTIEGFETMTADQKVEALLGLDVPEKIDLSGYVKKDLFDRTSSELAEAKKQIKAKMTDDEAARAQADADRKELEERYAELLRKSTIAEHTARYIAMPGYDEKLARETAEALFDGDTEKVFANQQKANAAYEKTLRSHLLKDTPTPGGRGGAGGKDETDNVARAREMGKQRAEAMNASKDIFGHFKI